MTKPQLEDQLAVMMKGRAAGGIAYGGEASAGAANDLKRVSELARRMVTRFGMSEALGHLAYGRPVEGGCFISASLLGEARHSSEQTAQDIEREVRRIVWSIARLS